MKKTVLLVLLAAMTFGASAQDWVIALNAQTAVIMMCIACAFLENLQPNRSIFT